MLEQMHEQTLLWWLCWGVTRVVRRERVGERGAHTLQAETGACTRAGSRYIATSGRPFALPVPDSRLQDRPCSNTTWQGYFKQEDYTRKALMAAAASCWPLRGQWA